MISAVIAGSLQKANDKTLGGFGDVYISVNPDRFRFSVWIVWLLSGGR